MKLILPLCLALVSCADRPPDPPITRSPASIAQSPPKKLPPSPAPPVMSDGESTRFHAFTDLMVASGGSFVILDDAMKEDAYPTSLQTGARRMCRDVMGAHGFRYEKGKPVDYILELKMDMVMAQGIPVYRAIVNLHANQSPDYPKCWRGIGVANATSPSADLNVVKLSALAQALTRFPTIDG